jgi:2-iminobutanoate/2-iminopropanoate deaminase
VSHHREPVTALGAPAAIGPYSHAVRAGGLLFCSGQIPLDEHGEMVSGTIADETRQCLLNLTAVCSAAGAQLEDSVRVTVYLTDLAADFAEVNDVYAEFFGGDPPARVAIGVAQLPKGARVEVDAVVALPS